MTCVLYYYFLKSYDSFVWRKPTKIIVIIVLYWTVMRIELINCELDQIMNESFRQQIFSQFWYFSRNFEFTSQNSDFFSQNCVIQSHNYDFFSQNCVIQTHNYDFFSQNCKFISHRFLTIFAQLLVISPVYKRQIFSHNCNNSDFISHNFEFIFRNCEFVSHNCVFLWLSGRA